MIRVQFFIAPKLVFFMCILNKFYGLTNYGIQGALNGYRAAECSQPSTSEVFMPDPKRFLTSIPIMSPSSAPTIDDILIDDYIENWECCSSLHSFYAEHCRNLGDITMSLLGFVIVLVVCVIVKSLVQKFEAHWLPESAGCILVGGEKYKKLSFFD